MTWAGCKIVGIGAECFSDDSTIRSLYDNYNQKIRTLKIHPVWYDPEDSILFSADENYRNTKSVDTCFLASREHFLSNVRHGMSHIKKIIDFGYKLGGELLKNEEIIIELTPFIENIKDKKILIIGAGPSSNMVNVDSIERDQVWVCNNFLKHETISSLDIDLFYMSNQVDDSQRTKEYIEKNKKTFFCFDLNVARDFSLWKWYKDTYEDRCFMFSTRLFTSIGTVPRLVALATLFGAKEVLVLGMDGHTREGFKENLSFSSFEAKKKTIPKGQNYGSQRREYVLFWEYILRNIGKDVIFRNLGDIYEFNISKDIISASGGVQNSQ